MRYSRARPWAGVKAALSGLDLVHRARPEGVALTPAPASAEGALKY